MIKKFDEFGYYEEIHVTEFLNSKYLSVTFDDSDISILQSLNLGEVSSIGDLPKNCIAINLLPLKPDGNWITIYKLKDEWFVLSAELEEKNNFYKCDQLDGVIKCLNDL